ncbi:MAG: ubiquitin-like domain-containing protein [Bacillota bacterium]|nr:ubiquitin-like domain-containing protein [Bacillota bacterium]NLU55476.1 DUF348 domain-containing protein [Bacillota bacterium]HOA91502.1 ubiquitin-like domain-containing protein [Bacillota bacterium]HOJ46902.1 ubiquitin-like domain-containing protein [Bacillota bacterium]HOL14095.1 ubiquitin-like domain-containing protein [Bacillota bacterium]
MGRVFKLASGVFLLITSVFFLVAGVSHQRYVPVTVHVGDNAITWKTPMKTVKSTLSELGIEVNPQDEVYPSLDAPITQNMHVTIIRRFDISVKDGWVDGGKAKTYTVSAQTVGDALKEIGIELSGADTIVPALDSPIGRGSTITITRRDSYYQTEYELIPYGLWEFSDNRIYEGTSQVWRQGESGTRAKTYLVKRENGVIVSRELVEDVVTKAPKLHVVAKGTKPRYYTLKTPAGNILYTKKITIEATAYYPGPESTGIYADGYTYTGVKAGHGIIAVDPKVIPLGTKVYIPGYGFAIAADIGGAIKGNIIDLCFDTYREAIQFGRRMVELYFVVDEGRL